LCFSVRVGIGIGIRIRMRIGNYFFASRSFAERRAARCFATIFLLTSVFALITTALKTNKRIRYLIVSVNNTQ